MPRAMVMVAGLLLPLTGLPAATADEPAPYPDLLPLALPRVTAIEADPARERAFVAGGGNTDHVEIVSSAGESVGSVPIEHAVDLVLSPDGSTMYVSVARGPARVDAIDLETLEVSTVAELDNGNPAIGAGEIIWAAHSLWVVTNTEGDNEIASVVPSTRQTRFFDLADGRVSTTAGAPDNWMVIVATTNELQVHQAQGGGDPHFSRVHERSLIGANITDVALGADDTEVFTVSGGYRGVPAFGSASLLPVDSLNVQAFADDIAVRDDGQVAVSHGDAVSVFAAGHTSFAARHAVPDDPALDLETAPDGLAWGDDELYSVLVDGHDTDPQVAVLPAEAPTSNPVATGIQGNGLARILAHPGENRAYLTQGADGNGVFVLDRAGRISHVLEHLPGATEMALNRSGRRLYVALSRGDAIAVVDTRTLRVRGRIHTGIDSCPRSVAVMGRRLWFTGGCYGYGSGTFGAIDLDRGDFTVRRPPGEPLAGTFLLASPTHPDTLWAATPELYNGELWQLRADEWAEPVMKVRSMVKAGPDQTDQALTPDGLHLLPATPGAEFHPVLDARTLELAGAADTQFNPVATAVRSDGLFAAGVANHFSDGWLNDPIQQWTIRVFSTALGRQVVHRRGLYLSHGAWVSPRGLAFGRRDLYAVHEDADGDLRVVTRRMPPVRPLTLTADRAAYERGERARLVAHVTVRPRTVVRIHRVTRDGRTLVERGRPDRFGNLATRVKVKPGQRFVATMGTHRSRIAIEGVDAR